ncbi:MAG: hypothetical protein ACYDH9_16415 [Limisphaerales bacterium]
MCKWDWAGKRLEFGGGILQTAGFLSEVKPDVVPILSGDPGNGKLYSSFPEKTFLAPVGHLVSGLLAVELAAWASAHPVSIGVW